MHASEKIRGFDGLRAIAALLVVLTHLDIWTIAIGLGVLTPRMLPMLTGTTGVQIFFILSGFLITLLLVKEHRSTGNIAIGKFMIRRSLRILPLYCIFCVLSALMMHYFDHYASLTSLMYVALYVYNFIPVTEYSPVLGHTWSLAVEEHFYLIWPFLFGLAFAKRRAVLIAACCAFVFAALVSQFFLLKSALSSQFFVDRWSFIAGYNIAIGCIGALVVSSDRYRSHAERYLSHPAIGVLGLVLFANSLYLVSDSWFIQNVFAGYVRAVGAVILVLWIYFNQTHRLVSALEWRPLRYVGKISYGLYMWQGFLLATGPGRVSGQQWPPSPLVGAALLVLVVPLSYRFIELPCLRLKERFGVARGMPPSALRGAPI